jgi:putative ABC transport system permease protein
VLIVAEVAMTLVLLAGAGLLAHSFLRLSSVDPGYDATRVLTFQVNLPVDRYPDARVRAFAEDLVARVRTMPGVRAAAYANQLPMVQLRDSAGGLWRTPDPGRKPAPGGADARLVSREYLEVMGIRIVAGRGFAERDEAGYPRVLLVNEALARRDFADVNPLGRFVYIGADPTPWKIVGIVGNVRQFGLDRDADPQFFVDLRQWPGTGMPVFPVGAYYAVLTDGEPLGLAAGLRAALADLDPQARLFNVLPMRQLVAATISRPRMYALLVGVFAAVAVTLAGLGIFGVVAASVSQRTREIGIRVALGARRSSVMRLVVRQSAGLFAAGAAIGLVAAAALTRYLEGLLFGLTPQDPVTFAAVVALLALVAAAASYIPARRALRVDPLVALRDE